MNEKKIESVDDINKDLEKMSKDQKIVLQSRRTGVSNLLAIQEDDTANTANKDGWYESDAPNIIEDRVKEHIDDKELSEKELFELAKARGFGMNRRARRAKYKEDVVHHSGMRGKHGSNYTKPKKKRKGRTVVGRLKTVESKLVLSKFLKDKKGRTVDYNVCQV